LEYITSRRSAFTTGVLSLNDKNICDKAASSLQTIDGKVREVDLLVAEIATACQEQSQGISQVNTAVTQMDKITQSTAAAAEESASAAEEVSAQAQESRSVVKDLAALVGSKEGASKGSYLLKSSQTASSPHTSGTSRTKPAPASPGHARNPAGGSALNDAMDSHFRDM